MRQCRCVDQSRQFTFEGIDHSDFVGLVRSNHKVAVGGIPAPIVEEALGFDHLDLGVVRVGIIHQPHLAGFLDIDDPFGFEVRGEDGGDSRLWVVFFCIVRIAAGADNFERFKCLTIQDDKMRWPIAADNGVLIGEVAFLTRIFADLNRTGVIAKLHLGYLFRRFHP